MSSARRRTATTLALGAATVATAATAATVGALALTGTPTGGTGGTAGSERSALEGLPTPVAATGLPAFTGCEELRRWYVRTALPRVGPWGFETPYGGLRAELAFADAATSETKAVGGSDTGTNVQEEGVDEPDLAKTDGEILVRIADRDLVVVDVSGERKRALSRTRLPGGWHQGRELLLVGDTVLVVGTYDAYGWALDTASRVVPGHAVATRTHLMRVDVSDPRHPRIAGHQRVDGGIVGAREYGDGTVRVVVGTGLPDLDFVHPTKDRTPREARRANRAAVRAAPVEDWLPGIRQGDGRGRHPLLGCGDVRHPEQESGVGTLSVLTLDIDDPLALVATAITAAGDLAYSSAGRLYVATMDSPWWDVLPVTEERALTGRGPAPSTQVHAFALDGGATTYVASGNVPGTVRDRWSFSEHDGRLRVATALGRGWQPRENAVHVLEETGDTLRVVGRVDGLGPREQIRSVRWLGDLAVVVTFRQTDPLYTLDLADPAHPRVLGELKIRGYSGYLHPVGDGLLLGLGQDATARGRSLGGQAAVFDLADTGAVRRTGTVGFPASAHLATEWEPRAFTYLPEKRTALVPVEDWRRERVRLVALRAGADGGLSVAGSWPLRRWGASAVRALPLPDGRLALVHRGVRIVDVG